jgi:hypothetical protein
MNVLFKAISHEYDLLIDKETIAFLVGKPNAEQRVKTGAENCFDARYPADGTEAEVQAAERDVEAARRRIDQLRKEKTPRYAVERIASPGSKPIPLETVTGQLGALLLAVSVLTIPAVAGLMIVSSDEIPLLADMPLLGAVFGSAALVFIVSALGFRDKVRGDEGLRIFDICMHGAAAVSFLAWLIAICLVAFGSGDPASAALESDWLADAATNAAAPSTEANPFLGFLFISTGLLDLFGAVSLHRMVADRLSPRPVKTILPDAERLHLDGLIQAAIKEKGEFEEKLRAIRQSLQQRIAARNAYVGRAQTCLEDFTGKVNAAVESARQAAIASLLTTAGPNKRAGTSEPTKRTPVTAT